MSTRSCSLACRLFFKRDPLVLEEAPHRPVACRRAALGQLGHHRPQGQVRLFGDPRQQPRALAFQLQRPPPTHRLGCSAAARTPAPPPAGPPPTAPRCPPPPKTAPLSLDRCDPPPLKQPPDRADPVNRV